MPNVDTPSEHPTPGLSQTSPGQSVPDSSQSPPEQTTPDTTDTASSISEDNASPTPPGDQSSSGSSATTGEEAANGDSSSTTGVIYGDVYYRGVAVSLLLDGQHEALLGEPLGSREVFYYYEGMEIQYYETVAQILFLDLSMFEIGGISLDKSRTELIEALGNPVEYYLDPNFPSIPYHDHNDDSLIRYHISSETICYALTFVLNNPEREDYCAVWRIPSLNLQPDTD